MANIVENVNQAISDFDSIKEAIEDKGVTVGTLPTSQYASKIGDISGGGAEIYFNSYGHCHLKSITFPDTVIEIDAYAYRFCTTIEAITFADSIKKIGVQAFDYCTFARVEFGKNSRLGTISNNAFANNESLTTLILPSSLTSMSQTAFSGCTNLEFVTFGQNFNCTLNLSASTKYSVDTMVAMFEALKDLTGQTAKTLTLGATNLAKLTAEQKQIATSKNWNLA